MRIKALYTALSGAILLSAATFTLAQTSTTPPATSKSTAAPTTTTTTTTKDTTMAHGATMSKADYKAEKDRIEADYKAANAKCKDMSGNAKDVCHKEAKGDENVKKAELEAKYKGTDKAAYDAEVAKAKAKLDVAQEKCDDMKGNEKAACKKQAKADEQKAIADAKAAHGKQVATAPSSSTTAARTTTTTPK